MTNNLVAPTIQLAGNQILERPPAVAASAQGKLLKQGYDGPSQHLMTEQALDKDLQHFNKNDHNIL